MRRLWPSIFIVAMTSGPAIAENCDWVDQLAKDGGSEFTKEAVCSDPPDPACRWSFDYRAPGAHETFQDIKGRLAKCLGAPIAQDTAVNHPDSYTLVQFGTRDAVVSLSLKDKANLQQTFVFLRVDNSTE